MGDRYYSYEDCPKCGGKQTVEVYNAPSCYQFLRMCDECKWTDGLDYYETEPNTIELMTKEQAKERGLEYQSGLEAALKRRCPN